MRRLLRTAIGRTRGRVTYLARRIVGSRRTRRFIWAQWAWVRLASLAPLRPLYGRVNVEWDVPGHGRAVTSEIIGPGSHEVLLRAVASVVSPGRERADFRRETSANFPILPGSSLAGEVVAVGRSVSSARVGQLVATQAPHASLVVRPADLVFPLPPGVDADKGAFLFLGMTALHGLWQGELRPGERVAVLGRGAIGQLVVQLARALGASEVLSVALSRRHAGHSLREAAGRVIATAEDEDGEKTLDALGADLTVEASGAESAWLQAIRATRSGGRVVLLGVPPPTEMAHGMVADRGVSLLVAHASTPFPDPGARGYRERARTFLDLLAKGALDLQGLIGREVNPWEAGRFYRELAGTRPAWVTALFRWDLLSDEERMRPVHRWAPPDTELARGMSMKRLPIADMLRPPLGSRPGA